eukprot:TRINITY_DN14118_c0_g1_i1.p1 TRINITY_DN14118_c0_g1~~TRINITY_DN14118_c0_g1_i1.p1  ORF type:complete len:215 (-),score=57.09 TRINITY_DN14118_c0_g1_i1:67-711(-)
MKCEECKKLIEINSNLLEKIKSLEEQIITLQSIKNNEIKDLNISKNITNIRFSEVNKSKQLEVLGVGRILKNNVKGFYSRIGLIESNITKLKKIIFSFEFTSFKSSFEIGFIKNISSQEYYDEYLIGGSDLNGLSLMYSGGYFKKIRGGGEERIELDDNCFENKKIMLEFGDDNISFKIGNSFISINIDFNSFVLMGISLFGEIEAKIDSFELK